MLPLTVADQIRTTLLDYLITTFNFQEEEVEQALLTFLQDDRAGLFKGPYVHLRLPFRQAGSDEPIPLEIAPPFTPYLHQVQAFQRLTSAGDHQPQPTLVTTGTGSGKTESFLYPILDHCYRHRQEEGIKAIILYPMNALATDQAARLARILWNDPRLNRQVTAGIYVGGQSEDPQRVMGPDRLIDEREVLRQRPPHILLTNYRMLDFLLLRPEDRELWQHNGPDSLRYLVLDELHTYDGAQGADVACLIRRLRSRLAIPAGYLCPIGTSATIGSLPQPAEPSATFDSSISQSPSSNPPSPRALDLPGFASQIFGQPVGPDAVVGESRKSVDEFLPSSPIHTDLPERVDLLAEVAGESYESYLARLIDVWFGKTLDVYALAQALADHAFLRTLLDICQPNILSLERISQRLARLDPDFARFSESERGQLLISFFALIAHARINLGTEEPRPAPFLTLQSQLWIREMRRLMRTVSPQAAFFWRDDVPSLAHTRGLPPYFCRECGHTGWLALLRHGDERLNDDSAAIYRHYFDRSRHCCYLYPGQNEDQLPGTGLRLCPACLALGHQAECAHCGSESFPVVLHRELSTPRSAKHQPQDLQRCPRCGTDGGLSIVGSQAASLSSVAIGHLYTSPLNPDKKLLAFTDSVQDAAHRAAFFGARTYRFNLRTAFQTVIDAAEGGGNGASIPLDQFTDRVLDFWREQWQGNGDRELRLAAIFMPPDLRDESIYRTFIDESAAQGRTPTYLPAGLQRMLHQRLSWEVTMEFAFNARLGRSLEKVGSATAFVDERALAEATERLHLRLQEEVGLLSVLDPATLTHFVVGLLTRTRTRGGVAHPFLQRYAEDMGNWYLLSKRMQPWLSPFHRRSRLPKLLTDSGRRDVFDLFRAQGSNETWYVDWARRVLDPALGIADINDIYRLTIEVLSRRQILHPYASGAESSWAIAPECLLVTQRTASLRCDHCHDQQTVSTSQLELWRGKPCLSYRCPGQYGSDSRREQSYYRALYSKGHLARIFSHEHTGLLERSVREGVENQFKQQKQADAINLLAATSTLEMGIDVGDLSGTMACSVPPAPANYLQRIGRAGRATGNSLVLTLANATPHDLYFFDDPLEMIAGEVAPPGCFLNAPSMLQRQFLAFCLDTWTSQSDLRQLPHNVKALLAQAGRQGFPHTFLAFYTSRKEGLIASFLALFGTELDGNNRQALQTWAESDQLPQAVLQALADIHEEREELRRIHRHHRERQRAVEADPAEYEQPAQEIERIQQDAALIRALIQQIEEVYVLNFFTDAGLLPNYAFPESGVKLRSFVTFFTPQPDGKRYIVKEYQRPASQAIRELAPFNTFYAESRKVTVSHVEVPGREKAFERWQFCNRCGHMARVQTTHYSTACPQCGSTFWSDQGQQHQMVLFRQASAWTQDIASRLGDDDDEREQASYQIEHFFATIGSSENVGAEVEHHAFLAPGVPFGFEYMPEVTLREINFGPSDGGGSTVVIADAERSEQGFRVCRDCGVALPVKDDPDDPQQIRHTRSCVSRVGKVTWESVYLYREVHSEVLRILLPVSIALVEETLANVSAALQLGLRHWLGGDPDHLGILPHTEVGRDGTHRRFLMIYDKVPGGTSYLRDLARPDNFHHLLTLARDALTSCTCRQGEKKACYRCLYSYHGQRKNELLDREHALKLIQQMLSSWEDLKPVLSLADVEMVSVLESELEVRLIQALARYSDQTKGWQLTPILHQGQEAWLLTAGEHKWRIEAQVLLGPNEDVAIPSRADFLFRPLGNQADSSRPLALFTDGFAYHAQPGAAQARIWDDVRKRQAIWQSGRFWVWSLTWNDVSTLLEENIPAPIPFLDSNQQLLLRRLVRAKEISLSERLVLDDGMSQLLAYLASPAKTDWQILAHSTAAALLNPGVLRPSVEESVLHDLVQQMQNEPNIQPEVPANAPSGNWVYNLVKPTASFQHLLIYVPLSHIQESDAYRLVLLLADQSGQRATDGYAAGWRRFLLLLNLFQFLPGFLPLTSEGVSRSAHDHVAETPVDDGMIPVDKATTDNPLDAPWQDARTWADPVCRPLLIACQSAGFSTPAVGWELMNIAGRVAAVAELAWEMPKVAVFLADQVQDIDTFSRAGWQTYLTTEIDPICRALNSDIDPANEG